MKLPAPPIVSEVELGPLSKNARKQFTTLRHYGEMWKIVAIRREANEVEFQNQISVLKSDNSLLRERVSKWETPTSGTGDLPEDLPFHPIGNRTQVHRNDLFGDCDKKYGHCDKKV